ncbi:MAG: hypothetical protein ACHQT8_08115, partial [Chlamydiales bacterium]
RTLKGVCLIVSAGAKIPYIPIALTLPGGPFFAFANSAAFFNLEYWAITGTIDDVLGPKGEHEIILQHRQSKGRCYLVAIISTSVALALLSQIPIALPALDYNRGYQALGFGVLLGAGALLPVRSIQLSIEKSLKMQKCILGEVGKQVEAVRSEMLLLVDEHREFFRQMEYLDKLEHLAKVSLLREGEHSVGKVDSYAQMIFDSQPAYPAARSASLCDRASSAIGLWLTSSFQVAITMYTWTKTKEHMIDNDYVAGGFAAAVLATGVYLTGKSIIQTTQLMFRSLFNCLRCKKERTIAEQVRPKLCLSVKLMGLMLNLAALGPTVIIWGDFFKDNRATQAYFEGTMCAALFLLLSTATLDTVDMAVEEIVVAGKNLTKKEVVQYHRDIQIIARLLDESPLVDFSIFILGCPDELKTQLLERANLSIEALEGYIARSSDQVEHGVITEKSELSL